MLCHRTGRGGRCSCFHHSPYLAKSFRTQDHPGGRSDTNSSLVAITTMVSTSTTSLCGPPSLLSVQPGSTVTTGICLGWQVIPSACLEALMQHYQTAGFLRRSLDSWKPLEDPQHTECTTTSGFASLTELQDKELISLIPQLLK